MTITVHKAHVCHRLRHLAHTASLYSEVNYLRQGSTLLVDKILMSIFIITYSRFSAQDPNSITYDFWLVLQL